MCGRPSKQTSSWPTLKRFAFFMVTFTARRIYSTSSSALSAQRRWLSRRLHSAVVARWLCCENSEPEKHERACGQRSQETSKGCNAFKWFVRACVRGKHKVHNLTAKAARLAAYLFALIYGSKSACVYDGGVGGDIQINARVNVHRRPRTVDRQLHIPMGNAGCLHAAAALHSALIT